jgi:hypothetical protein
VSEDTRDFSQPPASQIVHRGTKTVNNGSIILMHDAGGKRDRPAFCACLKHFRSITPNYLQPQG